MTQNDSIQAHRSSTYSPAFLILAVVVGVFTTGLLSTADTYAEDWPQWRGPIRDGVWREGLRIRWRARIGRGYAGPVVAVGRVYVTDHQFEPEVERVLCFDEVTGESVWTHTYPYDCGIGLVRTT